jgi:ech hydrogenase subunit E
MAQRTIVPFGPQHPVLPEPIHLDLVLEDEKVVQAIPSIGFVHRGLEGLAAKKDFHEMAYVAERICGICSAIHGIGYCTGIEALLQVEIPPRAARLRVVISELSRIHSHILWAGLLADAFGFESLFMHSWRVREMVLDLLEEATGGRVIFGICKVGGLRRDVDDAQLQRMAEKLDGIEKECRVITDPLVNDSTVKSRTVGVGRLPKADAELLGAVGPTARASGIAMDARKLGYSGYDGLKWEPVVEQGCDSHARSQVRVREIYQSFDLIRQCLKDMPAGEIDLKIKPGVNPKGEYAARLEQPRGEVIYYLKGNGTKNLERFRVRTPTFANVAPLVKMLEGCELADVPVIVLTIDPCISCTER